MSDTSPREPRLNRRGGFRRAFSRLFVAKPTASAQSSWRAAISAAIVVVALGSGLSRLVFVAAPAVLADDDSHRLTSVQMALNWVVCGKYSHQTVGGNLNRELFSEAGFDRPLRSLALATPGGLAEYCGRLVAPARINENSLMLTMSALLRVWPDLSLRQLGWAMHGLRLAVLALVAIVLFRAGASLAFALLWITGALVILSSVEHQRFHSVYPFLAITVVGVIALTVLLVDTGASRSRLLWTMVSVGAGLLVALAANFRTSYLPIFAALLGVAAVASAPGGMRRWQLVLLLVLGAGIGYSAFQRYLITPIDELPLPRNLTYHHVFHPLVLALALPPNELAEREGLAWDDKVGYDIAVRIRPDVEPLSADYETALSQYYFGLWRTDTLGMLRLYWSKWRIALTDIPSYGYAPYPNRLFTFVFWPVSHITHGAVYTALFASLVPLAYVKRRRWNGAAVTLVAAVGVAGTLLSLETAIILTYFRLTHEASQMLLVYTLSLGILQAFVNLLATPFRTTS
jgi:hypothetical protein